MRLQRAARMGRGGGGVTAFAQRVRSGPVAPGQTCTAITQANADASAGTVNINHDGTPIAGIPAPDISRGFDGIPRSARPRLTASQQRILECTHRLAEANAEIPYTLFVPSTYDPQKPAPLLVDLHGLNITPLQQILFDGTTDFAERYGFIVLAPMGFDLSSWWGSRPGKPVATAAMKPGEEGRYSTAELAEIDTMALLKLIQEQYAIDSDRIYLMGHSMGGAGTYYLGAKYKDIWAGLAPISGARGIADGAAERYKSVPMLIMHGAKDSIVPPATSRRTVAALQAVGAPHIYLEFPDRDHEFWIRRGAARWRKCSSSSAWCRSGPPSLSPAPLLPPSLLGRVTPMTSPPPPHQQNAATRPRRRSRAKRPLRACARRAGTEGEELRHAGRTAAPERRTPFPDEPGAARGDADRGVDRRQRRPQRDTDSVSANSGCAGSSHGSAS